MSVQSMAWALAQSDLKDPTARHVLLCLANYANKEGRGAFPSASSLSEDTGLSVRTVKYKLDLLEKEGYIKRGNQAIAAAYIDRQDRRPIVYDMATDRGAPAAPGCERGASEDASGCNPQQSDVQLTTERGAPAAPNPSLNHHLSINNPNTYGASAPAKNRKTKFDPLAAKPGNVSDDAWAEWCQFRREIRKPLTATMCAQQARTLDGHHNPDAVLRQSIGNGWTGIFPDKLAAQPANVHKFPGNSRHSGFDDRDYTKGLTQREDGTYAF